MNVLRSGRSADVHDLGDGTVLRRRRDGASSEGEAAVMRWAARHGVPVPAVVSVDGPDLVMERLEGPTLLEQLAEDPSLAARAGAVTATMHHALDEVPAPRGLRSRHAAASPAARARLLHGDLHPGNVVATPRGPVLIDWTDAHAGDRAADVAETWLLLGCYETGSGAGWGQVRRTVLTALLSALDADAARRRLRAVAATRLLDVHTSPAERRAITDLVEELAT